MAFSFYNLSTAPAPYDIVWCRFPHEDGVGTPKMRPALVRQVLADQDGNPWVEVAYGTTRDPFARGHENFAITNAANMNAAGLFKATRFRLDRCIQLPWASEYFTPLLGFATPVIGALTPHLVKLLQVQMAYFQAAMDRDRSL